MLEQLIPSRRHYLGSDPIFTLNAEAQQRKGRGESILNATVGALADDNGQLVLLESIMALWRELEPEEVAPYAPIAGDPRFLRALVQRHWPVLEDFGVGCATPGGSGALALSVRNLLEPGMAVLCAGPYWGPYATLAGENGARLVTAPFPVAGQALDQAAWERAAGAVMAEQKRLLVWLNDPCHNPTGHSLTRADRVALFELLDRLSQQGPVTLLLDCAYLDYSTDPQHVRDALDHYRELGAQGRVLLAASLSLSKAFTLYGGRGGALVFPGCRSQELQGALNASCRGLFSNCPRAPQALMVRLARDGKRQAQLSAEHKHWSEILESRVVALNRAFQAEGLPGVAWKGGFFITLASADPQGLCARLRGLGVYLVPLEQGVRVGICALPAAATPALAQALRAAAL